MALEKAKAWLVKGQACFVISSAFGTRWIRSRYLIQHAWYLQIETWHNRHSVHEEVHNLGERGRNSPCENAWCLWLHPWGEYLSVSKSHPKMSFHRQSRRRWAEALRSHGWPWMAGWLGRRLGSQDWNVSHHLQIVSNIIKPNLC